MRHIGNVAKLGDSPVAPGEEGIYDEYMFCRDPIGFGQNVGLLSIDWT